MVGPAPDQERDLSPEGRHAIPTLEWIVGGAGALMVAALVGYLVFSALGRDETPPDVRFRVLETRQVGEVFLVRFEAKNEGSLAAAALTVEGKLEGYDGRVETGEATIDYLPPQSTREAGLVFRSNPALGHLTLTAKGFSRP
jgi:uncharacterized protein (TIGR02588 family)